MTIQGDTSRDAWKLLLGLIRAQTSARKLEILDQEFALARSLMSAGIRLRRPSAGPEEIRVEMLRLLLGHHDAERVLAFERRRGVGAAMHPAQHGPATG